MSRDAPPPLPGGYKVGDKVFYTAANHNFADGDKLVHGQQGEVTGPPTLANVKGKGVKVLFPGNKGDVDCYLTDVRRLHAASAAIPPAYAPHATLHAHAPRGPCSLNPTPAGVALENGHAESHPAALW